MYLPMKIVHKVSENSGKTSNAHHDYENERFETDFHYKISNQWAHGGYDLIIR